MEDDEENLSNVTNKHYNFGTESKNFEMEENECFERCESFHQLSKSTVNVGEHKINEAVLEEDKLTVFGEEEDANMMADFYVKDGEMSVSDVNETQVIVEETQIIDSLDQKIDTRVVDESTLLVDKVVTDTGDEVPETEDLEEQNLQTEEVKISEQCQSFHQLSESDTVDGQMNFSAVFDTQVVVIDSLYQNLETKVEEESSPLIGTDVDATTGGDGIVTVIGDEALEMREQTEELDAEAEVEREEEMGVENDENDAEADVCTAESGEEKIYLMVNDSNVGNIEERVAIEDGRISTFCPEEIFSTEAKRSADVKDELAEDKVVAPGESLMPETKLSGEKNLTVEVLKDPELDEPMNTAENIEEAGIKEDVYGGLRIETGVLTETISVDVAEEIKLAGMKMEIDEAKSDAADTPLQEEEDETMEAGTQDTEVETETDVAESDQAASTGKRKHGEMIKSSTVSKALSRRKSLAENVCFICFDGGELVLCDRRGCPKAYHPSCVNRDEAFFKTKGHWNCGWHMCSICEKNAQFFCYTCTFSSCKSCTKDSTIFLVRGNKGFCEICMRTVRLIENNEEGNIHAEIDFNDKSSWEHLFKDYYIDLKSKLSLSSAEIAEAKIPYTGGASTQESPEAPQSYPHDKGSDSDDSTENLEPAKIKRKRAKKQSKPVELEKTESNSSPNPTDWVSKELLELISHMKNGDTSVLSQFDVQALLLEYIKTNKLRDPRRKGQIICDTRLKNLFGKPRVGHFEMLELLESHFLVRDDSIDDAEGSVVDTKNNDSQLGVDDDCDKIVRQGSKSKKRKTRRKGENRGRQSNLDDYAAIDVHNIGLIYLRRKLIEDLLEDVEKFHDKVVGTFVKIRIAGNNQKQELYRLVQVVGTSKGSEPYKIGKKTTNTMVEILNLDKTELIPIDTVSNQDFTEEECNRLRQSIKCGLISRLSVGEVLDKAVEIQTARVNDWLESETLRLSHLRDRASDLGRRKELRECVEKLQLLKTPEERERRLDKIPEIHDDPKMDPTYESDEEDTETEEEYKQEAFSRPRGSGFSRRGRAPISPNSDNYLKDSWSGSANFPSQNWESNKIPSSNNFSPNQNSSNQEKKREIQECVNLEKLYSPKLHKNAPASSLPSVVSESVVKIKESEKMWHYQDPSGTTQGPFSLVKLRKWNNTGYFPLGLRIWKTTENQENSISLADALARKFPKSPPNVDQNNQSHSKSNSETRAGNDVTNLPSPTPKQSNSSWNGGEKSLFTSANQFPAPVLPNTETHSSFSNPSIHSSTPISPTPNQPAQPQGHVWGAQSSGSNISNSAVAPMPQSEFWGHQPNAPSPAVTNTLWGVWPTEENFGAGPENPNTGWGVGPDNSAPVNPNMNWGEPVNPIQGPLNGNNNTTGWVAQDQTWGPPPPVQSNGWGPPQVQNNGWGPPLGSGNNVWDPPPPVQGNSNQGWVPWGGSGPTTGRDSAFGGRKPGFGGGGGSRQFNRREMICPYNANGRCKKGAYCDYRHN